MNTLSRDLPHPMFVARARQWLLRGAPIVAAEGLNAGEAVQTLLELLDALPAHHALYRWNAPEHREACTDLSFSEAVRQRQLRERRAQRPRNYMELSAREQWSIDKDLGLLDDDGS